MTIQAMVLGIGSIWLLALARGLHFWVSLLMVAAIGAGVGIFWYADSAYLDFAFYLVQALMVIIATSFYTRGRVQKMIIAIVMAVLVTVSLLQPALGLNTLVQIEHRIYLSLAFSFLPMLLFAIVPQHNDSLEKVIVFQQTWLRVSFIFWTVAQSLNIYHYELFERFAYEFSFFSMAAILLSIFLKKYISWALVHQAIFTQCILVMALNTQGHKPEVLLLWVYLAAMTTLFPHIVPEKFKNLSGLIRRWEVGALGGGYFWSMLMAVYLASSQSTVGALLWTSVVFMVGIMAWIVYLPSAPESSSGVQIKTFALGSRASVQLLMSILFALAARFMV
ncbi:MAG: hypothetical protein AB7F59_00995 [Bdellovibrionales bacterium]